MGTITLVGECSLHVWVDPFSVFYDKHLGLNEGCNTNTLSKAQAAC